jgi:hypothetical protein
MTPFSCAKAMASQTLSMSPSARVRFQASCSGPCELEDLLQIAALDEPHGEVEVTLLVDSQLMDRGYSWVFELAGHLRFPR